MTVRPSASGDMSVLGVKLGISTIAYANFTVNEKVALLPTS